MISHYCPTCEISMAFLDITLRDLADQAPVSSLDRRVLGADGVAGASDLIHTVDCVSHLVACFTASVAMVIDDTIELEYLNSDGTPVDDTVDDLQSVSTRIAIRTLRAASAYDAPADGYPAALLHIESACTSDDPVPEMWAILRAVYETGLSIAELGNEPSHDDQPPN